MRPHRRRLKRFGRPLKFARLAPLILAAAIASGCSRSVSCPPGEGEPAEIYTIRQGWHTGLAFSLLDIPEIDRARFPWLEQKTFLEVGFGATVYYPRAEAGLIQGLQALFVPAPGVIRLTFFDTLPFKFFEMAEIQRLVVKRGGLLSLITFLEDSLDLDEQRRAKLVGSDRTDPGLFYRAKASFSLFNNCNDWVLEALRSAGCDTPAPFIATARYLEDATKPPPKQVDTQENS